ncbi:MAG: DNA-3-methyladenine glycosylase 2 family protein [Rhizobiales bacterium]|nr:DNA-3-methyladenine glycosylase 2 family protein [Hyphomicrobiales bacterium]
MADIEVGVKALAAHCPAMARAWRVAGLPPLRRDAGGFEGLVRIVIGQQVSTASARAIHARFANALQPLTPGTVRSATDDELRAVGLSRPKIATIRAVAEAFATGAIAADDLAGLGEDELRRRLLAIHGIGPWSCDIYLLFGLGRVDAFAPGDLALQVAAGELFDLETRPDARALALLSERWRPWRGVAARLLWAYYGKRREGAATATEAQEIAPGMPI